jgi:hypothetical protein
LIECAYEVGHRVLLFVNGTGPRHVTRFSSYPFFIVSIVPIVFFVPLARGPFSGSSNPTTGMCCSLPTGRATAQGTKNTMATMGTMEFLGFNILASVFILSIFIVSIVPSCSSCC